MGQPEADCRDRLLGLTQDRPEIDAVKESDIFCFSMVLLRKLKERLSMFLKSGG